MKIFKEKKRKGFTMVELLAVIVILGILAIISITAVQGIIAKAKERYYKSQEENMVMAAQSYLKNNNKQNPKVSGQTKTIKLNTLYTAKYIDKVVDYKKQTCDGAESYVKAFKYEGDIYYTAYLKCPNYETDMEQLLSSLNITNTFYGDNQNPENAKATFVITDSNGGDGRIQKGIISYQYSVYKEGKLIYSSDIYNTKKTDTINKTISLSERVPGKIKISITATNIHGLSKTKSFTHNYTDTTPPVCGEITGASTTWNTGKRTITVGCSDVGSGCKRDSYTYEFSGDVKVGKIEIADKAGNTTNCDVNVYLDNYPPVVTLKAYKKKAGEIAPQGSVMNQITNTMTSPNKSLTINGDTVNGWMNKAKWPNGVYLELDYSDISQVSKIEWKWNAVGLQKTNANVNVITQTSQTVTPNNASGKSKEKIENDGYRYGEIIITDQFNHTSTIKVTAPLDRVLPDMPVSGDSTTWINTNRTINIGCTDAVSGCKTNPYSDVIKNTLMTKEYSVEDKAGNVRKKTVNVYVDKTKPKCGSPINASNIWTKNDRNISIGCSDDHSKCSQTSYSKFFNTTTKIGQIEIKDNAGNTEICNVNAYVDKTPPKCNGTDGSSTNWTNLDRTITVRCDDNGGSGCKKTSYQQTFTSNVKTANITIEDNVGYKTDCPVNVYLDKSAPTCGAKSGEGSSSSWTKNDRNITVACNDSGESGCSSVTKNFNSNTTTSSITLKDGAGNTVSCPVNVYIDKSKPTITYNIYKIRDNGSYEGPYNSGEWSRFTIKRELSPSDTGGSGIDHTEYSPNERDWYYEGNVSSWMFGGDGTNDTYFRTIDKAGNISDTIHFILKVDKTKPSVSTRQWIANNTGCYSDYEIEAAYNNKSFVIGSKKFWGGFLLSASDSCSGLAYRKINYWYEDPSPAACGRHRYYDDAWDSVNDSRLVGCGTSGGKIAAYYFACDNANNCTGTFDHYLSISWGNIYSLYRNAC